MPPLFLIGFMAAGKTSVGRATADATRRKFVDLDDAISALGEPAAALVARDEPEFRRREAAALEALIAAGDDAVIATGGGAAASGDNLERMKAAGCVIALGVDVEEARRRATGGPARPLLVNAEALAKARAPIYRRAHAVVDTSGTSIADVAAHVIAIERVWKRVAVGQRDATTLVALGERSYPIVVADVTDPVIVRDAIAGGTYGLTMTRVEAITDRNVLAAGAVEPLRHLLAAPPLVIEPGEASKSFATYERLCNELIDRGVDRSSTILAIGGGVVGDLAGFVAASLFRGIRVIQVPTTILAMADAAIGGKTAIDLPAGKNLVGAFWQPSLVACGMATLTTLPARERRAAFGELWKYALLDGRHLWKRVADCAGWAAGPDHVPPPPVVRDVIERAIAYKAAVVGRDERELTGHRALLNLGHTVGHAIESAASHTVAPMLHGEAVGLGLLAACRVSSALGMSNLESDVREALSASGLAHDLDRWLTEDVIGRIRVDKKRVGKTLRFVAIREVGACEPVDIPIDEVQRILRSDSRA
jgi:shikimate kinase / 3-dehydroquinate synthase